MDKKIQKQIIDTVNKILNEQAASSGSRIGEPLLDRIARENKTKKRTNNSILNPDIYNLPYPFGPPETGAIPEVQDFLTRQEDEMARRYLEKTIPQTKRDAMKMAQAAMVDQPHGQYEGPEDEAPWNKKSDNQKDTEDVPFRLAPESNPDRYVVDIMTDRSEKNLPKSMKPFFGMTWKDIINASKKQSENEMIEINPDEENQVGIEIPGLVITPGPAGGPGLFGDDIEGRKGAQKQYEKEAEEDVVKKSLPMPSVTGVDPFESPHGYEPTIEDQPEESTTPAESDSVIKRYKERLGDAVVDGKVSSDDTQKTLGPVKFFPAQKQSAGYDPTLLYEPEYLRRKTKFEAERDAADEDTRKMVERNAKNLGVEPWSVEHAEALDRLRAERLKAVIDKNKDREEYEKMAQQRALKDKEMKEKEETEKRQVIDVSDTLYPDRDKSQTGSVSTSSNKQNDGGAPTRTTGKIMITKMTPGGDWENVPADLSKEEDLRRIQPGSVSYEQLSPEDKARRDALQEQTIMNKYCQYITEMGQRNKSSKPKEKKNTETTTPVKPVDTEEPNLFSSVTRAPAKAVKSKTAPKPESKPVTSVPTPTAVPAEERKVLPAKIGAIKMKLNKSTSVDFDGTKPLESPFITNEPASQIYSPAATAAIIRSASHIPPTTQYHGVVPDVGDLSHLKHTKPFEIISNKDILVSAKPVSSTASTPSEQPERVGVVSKSYSRNILNPTARKVLTHPVTKAGLATGAAAGILGTILNITSNNPPAHKTGVVNTQDTPQISKLNFPEEHRFKR